MQKREVAYKICIFGDKRVGKTTLAHRYLTRLFNKNIVNTLGAEIHIKFLEIENTRVVLQAWDFGGEDGFRFLLPAYARGSFGGIFMFDITVNNSLKNVDKWLSVFRGGLKTAEKQIPIIMVGGKLDLEDNRVFSKEEAKRLLKSYNMSNYIECSSVTGENVELIFETLVHNIMNRLKKLKLLIPSF